MLTTLDNKSQFKPQQIQPDFQTRPVRPPENPVQTAYALLTDKVDLQGGSDIAPTYSASMSVDMSQGDKYDMLRGLVANLLKEQGIDTKISMGDTEVDLAGITQDEAAELVSDDGYFGVDKTSERIFQLAVGIAGGDPSRIDAIKEGVDKGFQDALDAFDGWLPDISYDTYDAVMEKLDKWVADSQSAE